MGQAKIKKLNAVKNAWQAQIHYNQIGLVIDSEFEPSKPTAGGLAASALALKEIKSRSFSGRNPELGKMIKCQVCQKRHRDSIKCEQKFVELYVEEDLETGEVTPILAMAAKNTRFGLVGHAPFKGKRVHPHSNQRNLQLIEAVRALLPDEYDENDLKKARTRARRILSKKLGRHGFLPPKWMKQTKAEAPGA
jgi:hypothetical protein